MAAKDHMCKSELCRFYYKWYTGNKGRRAGDRCRIGEDKLFAPPPAKGAVLDWSRRPLRAARSIWELRKLRGNEQRGSHWRVVFEAAQPWTPRDSWVVDAREIIMVEGPGRGTHTS